MRTRNLGTVLMVFLTGCSAHLDPLDGPISIFDIKPQVFTYTELNSTQDILWEKARRHIMSTYGKSQPILRVENKSRGALLGKGVIRWKISASTSNTYCNSEYDIRFMSRDNKARLQLLLLPNVSGDSECDNLVLPSKYGYEQILNKFEFMSNNLELALTTQSKI
ncbi:hypothetical protein [Aliivibrio sp. 1S128]|uniref:hypothetical protein n=1 Tax=Aliivibrio sp. 1S128 TaxID=1840085 RepID=UPI00080DF1DF|nr:hypothetical protein [Aliivibrio sp. 1S128]OCH19781.1 hypothetical protein A6E03_10675 [Aliivibrio sp. 1S128]